MNVSRGQNIMSNHHCGIGEAKLRKIVLFSIHAVSGKVLLLALRSDCLIIPPIPGPCGWWRSVAVGVQLVKKP